MVTVLGSFEIKADSSSSSSLFNDALGLAAIRAI